MWKVWRLVKLAKQAESCDSLVKYQEKEIRIGLRLQEAADSLIQVKQQKINISEAETLLWIDRYNNQCQLTKIEKKRKRKWRVIAIVGIPVVGWLMGQ